MTLQEPLHPECDKASTVREQSQAIGEFLEWLQYEKKLHLAEWREWDEEVEEPDYLVRHVRGEPMPMKKRTRHYGPELFLIHHDVQQLLAEFFDIDYDAMQKEQSALLKYVQALANNG